MAEELPVGCARPTGSLVGDVEAGEAQDVHEQPQQGARPMIQVGRKAPDFSAPAYFNGKFVTVKLSEYLGKWVALCFYPGDFTFV